MSQRLVVAPAWVGDMVMAQSLFKVIKERHPSDSLHVLAPASTHKLLDRIPEVDKAWLAPGDRGSFDWRARAKLARTLRAESYEQSIVLPGSLKSALIPLGARIAQRTGWLGEYRFGFLNDIRYRPKQHTRVVERFVALGLDAATKEIPCPWPELRVDDENCKALKIAWRLDGTRPSVALCPGAAFGEAKRWPSSSFATLALDMLNSGWQVWILGSQQESPLADDIMQATDGRAVNMCGQMTLADAVDCMSMATVAVSNDSGLMHIAAAVKTPVVAIYGSTDERFAPPLAEHATVLAETLPCRPCAKRQCPLGHLKCLWQITPDRVMTAIGDLYENIAD